MKWTTAAERVQNQKPQPITEDAPLPTAAFVVASHFYMVSHIQELLQIVAQGNACISFIPILRILCQDVLDNMKLGYKLVNELKCNAICSAKSDSVATLVGGACMHQ